MRLRIASRQSDLARIQAHDVARALKEAHPGLDVEFHFSESLGDKNLVDPLWKMPEKGVFTADLTGDLIAGRADMVVHSWKDLPTEPQPETEIVATLPRADVRDLLLFKKTSVGRADARIFSSSPRREYNLKPFLLESLPAGVKSIEFTSVRGNIPTRLRKLSEAADIDGLVVAKAAIDRLLGTTAEEFREARDRVRATLSQCHWMVLPLSANPAAPAQGALAIEIRRDRDDLRAVLAKIHDERTFVEANREREVLRSYGGGCHQKIGATYLLRDQAHSYFFLRGLTDKGVALREQKLLESNPEPVRMLRSDWLFQRQAYILEAEKAAEYGALFISHISAWPANFSFPGIIWTAGLSTWKKMAARGVWVNGSSEGLGETEEPRLERIAGELKWATLTHTLAADAVRGAKIATYKLSPRAKAEPPPRDGRLHWTSAVLFEEAVRRWPALLQRNHSCGPGKTFEQLRGRVKNLSLRWPAADEGSSSERI